MCTAWYGLRWKAILVLLFRTAKIQIIKIRHNKWIASKIKKPSSNVGLRKFILMISVKMATFYWFSQTIRTHFIHALFNFRFSMPLFQQPKWTVIRYCFAFVAQNIAWTGPICYSIIKRNQICRRPSQIAYKSDVSHQKHHTGSVFVEVV